jgi:hypothetical protein
MTNLMIFLLQFVICLLSPSVSDIVATCLTTDEQSVIGFRREVAENCAHLGYYAASRGQFLTHVSGQPVGPNFMGQESPMNSGSFPGRGKGIFISS